MRRSHDPSHQSFPVRGALTSLAFLTGFTLSMPSLAAPVQRFVLDTPRSLAGATGTGVAIFPDGSLSPLSPLEEVATFDEPLALALATANDGTVYVGTGHPARVWRVRNGAKELVGELEADQVTALLLDPEGDLYVSTAVPAVLLRLARDAKVMEMVSELPQGNIWDLAWFGGEVVAAAGNPGRLLRLGKSGLELIAEIPDAHARCLAVSGEVLLIGTSGEGRIVRWRPGEAPGVLYDSDFTEIADLAVAPDGTAWAAALTGDPTLGKPSKEGGEPTVTVTVGDSSVNGSGNDKGSATSAILHVFPAGAATSAYRFKKQIAGTLAWGQNGLVIGTGIEGELWQLVDDAPAELDTVDAAQVVALAEGGQWVLTQGQARLLHRRGKPQGSFISPPLDAGQPARWGSVQVRGEVPTDGRCEIAFRSGATAEPDGGWSAWTTPQTCSRVTAAAPPGRYLQWRVDLDATRTLATRVGAVEIAYRQVNLPPAILELTAHEPGEVFLRSPPPSDRIVEVNHPDLSGIFTTLDDGDKDTQDRLGKRYYRVGYQSLSWKAEDPNGDPLRFTVDVQRSGNDRWWMVRDNLETVVLALDTQALPDGLYRFRLSASDQPANPDEPTVSSALSSWVRVDNTPPRINAHREGAFWMVTVEDALSPIAMAEWNRDADTWHAVIPVDGLLDSRIESFRIPVASAGQVMAVRAVDDHHNRTTVALEEVP